ncbi:Piso0_004762 [Millerozyma farinosa CBS 7064]|uniref:Piso0_004762 protein n=1 Tax=Pichia sorbitophila (strain ATCC MYA-4447 / BCRC 22081 / CBS 7064 / NBRC 10061 / NRRL Y-12695) TaxID=559304 RepID=G8Y3B2_PICSO|nr:Piso0_004762 [Millerozyma farinosa CBS 7064]
MNKHKKFVTVCTNCKAKKKKCDREQPCSSCRKSHCQENCLYEEDANHNVPTYVLSALKPLEIGNIRKKRSRSLAYSHASNEAAQGKKLESKAFSAANETVLDDKQYSLKRQAKRHIEEEIQEKPRTPEAMTESSSYQPIHITDSDDCYLCSSDMISDQEARYFEKENLLEKAERNELLSSYTSLMTINPFESQVDTILGSEIENSQDGSKIGTWEFFYSIDSTLQRMYHSLEKGPEGRHQYSNALSTDNEKHENIRKFLDLSCQDSHQCNCKSTKFDEVKLKDTILTIAPSYGHIWILINRFFEVVYPHVPYINKDFFTYQISKSLKHDENELQIILYDPSDLAYLGILLVLLSLAQLSYFSNSLPVEMSDGCSSFIIADFQDIEHTIDEKVISVSFDLINYLDHQNQELFPTLLFIFYIKIYYEYWPTFSQNNDELLRQLNNILVNRATSLGLHQTLKDEESHFISSIIKKRLWISLVASATRDLSDNASRPHIIMEDFEVQIDNLSFFNDASSRINEVIKLNVKMSFLLSKMVKNANTTMNTSVSGICQSLTQCEKLLYDVTNIRNLRTSKVYDEPNALSFIRQSSVKALLEFGCLALPIFWMLSLFYQDRNFNMSYFYLKKALLLFHYTFPYIIGLSNHSKYSGDFIINPSLITLTHKSCQLCLCLLVRVNTLELKKVNMCRKKGQKSDSSLSLLSKIKKQLRHVIQKLQNGISSLRGSYPSVKVYQANIFELLSRVESCSDTDSGMPQNISFPNDNFGFGESHLDEISDILSTCFREVGWEDI